jgi:hypothetical protein
MDEVPVADIAALGVNAVDPVRLRVVFSRAKQLSEIINQVKIIA